MSGEGVGAHLAVALAAGAALAKKDDVPAAIKDRFGALTRALSKKGSKIVLDSLDSGDRLNVLAKELEETGAVRNRNVIETAKELLGLIRIDEAARAQVESMIKDVDAALVVLATVEVEEPAAAAPAAPTTPKAEASSLRDVTSRRAIPVDEPSKTELERTALPVWQRTDRFFLKLGVLVAAVIVSFIVFWVFIRVPPNDAIDRCKGGEAAKCWEVVAAEDTVDQGHAVSAEPLRILCENHDPCGCAGLAYLNAAATPVDTTADCNGLSQATAIDPTWPCSCARYNFWRWGKNRTPQCGIMRCE